MNDAPFNEFETALLTGVVDTATLQLPDPELLTYYKHLSYRKIWLDFNVDEYMLEVVRNIMLWNIEDNGRPVEERTPIWLYLFNYGGSLDLMWMITDVIQQSVTPVYTVNMGQCSSAAALIFMSGHRRFMLPSATVLIHEGQNQIGGDAVKVIDQAETYKIMIKKMREFIIAHTQIPQSTLSRKKNNDWELDSASCLKYGICDRIVGSMSEII